MLHAIPCYSIGMVKQKKPSGLPHSAPGTRTDVDAFLKRVAATPVTRASTSGRGRLIFAMDATASRQPAWDTAAAIQGAMFHETAKLGGLDIQLAFFRGFGEFRVSKWTHEESVMQSWMTSVACHAGETQLGKVLAHAANETKRGRVNALVYVGDCFEEDVDAIGKRAGELGLLGVPAFMFHEGNDIIAAYAFREVARLTRGAYCSFDAGSAQTLRDLLGAVAVFATGGRQALEDMAKRQGGTILQIAQQMKDTP